MVNIEYKQINEHISTYEFVQNGVKYFGAKLMIPGMKKTRYFTSTESEALPLGQAQYEEKAFLDRKAAMKKVQDERRAQESEMTRKAVEVLKVGDVFVNSWGYDQTNVDFYQVVALKGVSAVLRPITHTVQETGGMSGTATPCLNSFKGKEITKRVKSYDGKPRFSSSYGCITPWNGKPQFVSWYA